MSKIFKIFAVLFSTMLIVSVNCSGLPSKNKKPENNQKYFYDNITKNKENNSEKEKKVFEKAESVSSKEETEKIKENKTENKIKNTYSASVASTSKEAPVISSTKINLSNYTSVENYGNISPKIINLYKYIISLYEDEGRDSHKSIEYPEFITSDEYYQFSGLVMLKYGSAFAYNNFADIENYNNVRTFISLREDDYRQIKSQKQAVDSKIEQTLSNMNEGSETDKLLQISNYLRKNVKYNGNKRDVYNAMVEGVGNCNAFSLSFKMFAERMGIKCDFLTGYANNGKYHAWNRVYLSDGGVRYYDVTFYRSTGQTSYLNRSTSPFKITTVNSYE